VRKARASRTTSSQHSANKKLTAESEGRQARSVLKADG
jgi:hypothetical protein